MNVGSQNTRSSNAVHALAWSATGLLLLCAGLAGAKPEPAASSDLEIKAAFVLNFIRLVNWSTIPGEPAGKELGVCACSRNDFYNAVKALAEGKMIGERSIRVRIEPMPDALKCRVLLLDRADYVSGPQILSTVRDAPVLTVGSDAGILDAGAMFELFVKDQKVQFNVGLTAVRRSGLEVSARLLHLARNLNTSARSAN